MYLLPADNSSAWESGKALVGFGSVVARKNVESIAYRFGQDRLPLQRFIGWAEWDQPPCARS